MKFLVKAGSVLEIQAIGNYRARRQYEFSDTIQFLAFDIKDCINENVCGISRILGLEVTPNQNICVSVCKIMRASTDIQGVPIKMSHVACVNWNNSKYLLCRKDHRICSNE